MQAAELVFVTDDGVKLVGSAYGSLLRRSVDPDLLESFSTWVAAR